MILEKLNRECCQDSSNLIDNNNYSNCSYNSSYFNSREHLNSNSNNRNYSKKHRCKINKIIIIVTFTNKKSNMKTQN